MKKESKYDIPNFIQYHLIIASKKGERVIKEKYINNDISDNFSFPVTSKHPKIYIVKDGSDIIYVGYTHDSITNRLRNGLSPGKWDKEKKKKILGKDGYSGYKWKHLDKIDYFVWVFEDIDIPVTKEMRYMFENIEAEIVFQLKQKGVWPKYQSEIHFYSDIENQKPVKSIDIFGKNEKYVATEILDYIEKNK